jgi:Transglycosylase SLT domain
VSDTSLVPPTRAQPVRRRSGFGSVLLLGGALLAFVVALHEGARHGSPFPAVEEMAVRIPHLDLKRFFAPVPETIYVTPGSSAAQAEDALSPAALMARWEPLIRQASRKFDVPAEWIRAVMRQESGGRTVLADGRPIVSSAGALGIMQVMPGTYSEMAAQYGLGADPFNPHDNIYAGAAYLSWLHHKYGYPAMFAAYNEGPGNIEDHLYRGRPLPAETRGYITAIAHSLKDKTVGAGAAAVALTQPDGVKVTIEADKVTGVEPAPAGLYAPEVHAVVRMGKMHRGVREQVAEASRLLRAHGAQI